MSTVTSSSKPFRSRLKDKEPLVGILLKTSSYQLIEIAARTGIDFIIIDAEHAPFGPSAMDLYLMTCRALGLPAIVRMQFSESSILGALDMGAAGVMVAKVRDRAQARAAVDCSKYAEKRGFTVSARAGDFGSVGMSDHLLNEDERVAVILMIEDQSGIDNLEEIVKVDGTDGLFIGVSDLTVAMGYSSSKHADVQAAVERIHAVATRAGIPVGAVVGGGDDLEVQRARGVRLFVVGTDQSIFRSALSEIASRTRRHVKES